MISKFSNSLSSSTSQLRQLFSNNSSACKTFTYRIASHYATTKSKNPTKPPTPHTPYTQTRKYRDISAIRYAILFYGYILRTPRANINLRPGKTTLRKGAPNCRRLSPSAAFPLFVSDPEEKRDMSGSDECGKFRTSAWCRPA